MAENTVGASFFLILYCCYIVGSYDIQGGYSMKICVVGLGYIGLPTSAMFASHSCQVVGVDVIESVVNTLNEGKIHIEEPGLGKLVKECVKSGQLKASLVPEPADAFIIAVPTPNKKDEWMSCDLRYVLQAVESILPYLRKENTIIIESTIAPRSTDDFIKPMLEERGFIIGRDIYLAHCPERVLPGKILEELKYNNRIVGGVTKECTEHAAKIYEIFVQGEIIRTEAKTAELSKCMENTFRDVNIALSNELAKVCNELKINCLDVIKMANKHPRVNLLTPGPGVGGHCLAIDPYFIYAKAPETAKLIKLSRDINVSMPSYVVENITKILGEKKECKIAIFGVTYKGNIDDMRESPALRIIEKLEKKGYRLAIYDPHVKHSEYVTMEEAVEDAELIVILTDHDEFKRLDWEKVASLMNTPQLFDTRNMITADQKSSIQIINYGNLYQFLEGKEIQ